MKIISLTSENVKRLTAVHIAPDGNLVTISGKNGSGKTSVLDSIWWALAGGSVIQKSPIRKGQAVARIILNLGELIITRTFKQKEGDEFTTQIKVETADGAAFTSPQGMLNDLLGELTFDPLAFSRMAAKDQFNALRKFVPDIDFDSIAAHNLGDFNRRAEHNKKVKELEGALSIIASSDEPPVQPIDETELVVKLQKAGEQNTETERRKANRELLSSKILVLRSDAQKKISRANQLREEAKHLDTDADELLIEAEQNQEKINTAPSLPEIIDTATVIAELNAAKLTNQQYQTWLTNKNKRDSLQIEIAAARKASLELTEKIDARDKAKNDAIAAVKMPVKGVEFGDGEVLLNGVPFDQGSDAEQLRASVGIAAAMNPKLRVIRVRDGSLLDEDGLTLLAQLADERDMQIWLERVDSTGKMGFVLEDGHLKNETINEAIAS